jgi:hypothetical protein
MRSVLAGVAVLVACGSNAGHHPSGTSPEHAAGGSGGADPANDGGVSSADSSAAGGKAVTANGGRSGKQGNSHAGSGPAPASGGTGAGGGTDGGGGTGASEGDAAGASGAGHDQVPCHFDVMASVSDAISTVGIVEFSTDLPELTTASIQFGRDASYGMTAPVRLGEPNHRTLLLGMKPSSDYHFRVVAENGTASCQSDDMTITTGPVANGLRKPTLALHGDGGSRAFLLSSILTTGPAFVLDADGDYVWWYGTGEMARAALTHDGKYLWYTAVNVAGQGPSMKRVTLDGLEETDFTAEFGQIHHDFTILPDDSIAFIQHTGDDTDRVVERAPDGSMRTLLDVGKALGDAAHTHANSIRYFAPDQSYTVSELSHDALVKFTRNGDVQWTLGGATSDFTGDGAAWDGQHGHELLAPDHLLLFNNGPADGTSAALEINLDLDAKTATRVWEYDSELSCPIFGDVQRLANGNTLVTFSTLGVIREVDPAHSVVRELTWDLGGAVGYVTELAALYPGE